MKVTNIFLLFAVFIIICLAVLLVKKIWWSMPSDNQRFIGTWRLISVTYADGRANELCGSNPVGYIMYAKDGYMSVQIMRNVREKLHSDNFLEATPEESRKLWRDFFAYAGPFSVDTKQKIVTHHVVTNISPNAVGKSLQRRYRFDKDKLYLTTIVVPDASGEMEQTLVWQRVKVGNAY